jgi:hypothetical protein
MGNNNTVQNIFTITEIKLNRNGDTLWTLHGRFSLNFTQGVMVGGEYGLRRVNVNTDNYIFTYTRLDREHIGEEAIEHVRKVTLNTENPNLETRCQHVVPGYNIWMKNARREICLYNFETAEFIRGLLTMLRAFNIDYREAILEAPLWVSVFNGNYTTEYRQIEGYPLPITNPIRETYITCNTILNHGVIATISIEDRINTITPYIITKFSIFPDTPEYQMSINNIMEQLQLIFLYTHPNNDHKTVDEYIGFTDYGNRANPETTEHYLTAYGYTEKH